jgi:hypothetical protein
MGVKGLQTGETENLKPENQIDSGADFACISSVLHVQHSMLAKREVAQANSLPDGRLRQTYRWGGINMKSGVMVNVKLNKSGNNYVR